jgi:photosystem II stability/assembly factor-like uncharacterized protein
MAMSRTHHLIAVGLSAVVGLAVTSGAASSPAAFAEPVTSLALEPGSASVVYAASAEGGMSKSVNGGQTWQRLAAPSGSVTDLVAHPTRPGVVYAAMGRKGVFKTKDGGRSWQAMNTGLRGLRVSVLAIARTEPEVVYAGTLQGTWRAGALGYARRAAALIFKSTNGGRSWHEVWKYHPSAEVRDVTVDPKRARTIWATTYGPVLKTTDGGRTWPGVGGCTARACQLPGPMGHAGPGLPHVAVSPRTPRIVYLGAGRGVFRSPDGGRHWTNVPLPRSFTAFAFDPLAADTLFVGTNHGVYKRAEGGAGWQAIGRRAKAFSLAIDSKGTTLYVGTRRGVLAYQLRP